MITAKIKIKPDRSATKKILKKLDQGMDDLLDLGFAVSQESVPVDQGMLKKSGAVEREFLNKKIIYASPIAPYVEYGCFDERTEILSIKGWLSMKEVSESDIVMTLNPNTLEAEWQKVNKKVEFDYKGNMCYFKNRAIPMFVTPNHSIWMFNRERKHLQKHKAINIPSKGIIPRIGTWVGKDIDYYTIPEYIENHYLGKSKTIHKIIHKEKKIPIVTWLKFMGLFLSEGHVAKYRVTITQGLKSRHLDKIQKTMSELPFDVKIQTNHEKCDFRINSIQLSEHLQVLGGSHEKFIPQDIKELKKEYLECLLRYLLMGDGCYFQNGYGNYYWRYYTASKRLAGDLQEILLKTNKVGQLKKRIRAPREFKNRILKESVIYEILIRENTDSWIDKRDLELIPHEGKVYSVSVDNQIVFVRFDGSPYFSGNTKPHWPPIEPLVDWAHRVLDLPYARKRTERRKGARAGKQLGFGEAAKMREGSAEQVGFLIAKKISEEGTEPQPFLRPALDELKAKAPDILKKYFK